MKQQSLCTISSAFLPLLVAAIITGCAPRPMTETGPAVTPGIRTAASALRIATPPPRGVALNYGCPDLFEGHIFSCPTIPSVSLNLDMNTDAIGGGVELGCAQGHGGVCVVPGIEYGRGSESYYLGGFENGGNLDYSVLQLKAHGRYAFPVNADSSLTISPLGGPRFYRFSYIDCPFEAECSENLLVLDIGAGVQYKSFGVDVFTGIGGPNFMMRFKYFLGF